MVNVCTSVNEEFENLFSVYPNPSKNGAFNISYPTYLIVDYLFFNLLR
jgi:hypothetical protein